MTKGRRWTTAEDEYLLQHYGKINVIEVRDELDRTIVSIRKRAQRLGITNDRGHNHGEAHGSDPLTKFLNDFERRHTWGPLEGTDANANV